MKNKIKLLALPLIALSLTGCTGASASGIEEKQQNFITNTTTGELITGSVIFNIGSKTKYEENWKEVQKTLPKNPLPGQRDASQTETRRMSGSDLASIVYDTPNTGSYTYNFIMKDGVFKDYQDKNGNLTLDSYLSLYFHISSQSKLKQFTFDTSTIDIVCKYDYTDNGKTEEHIVEYPGIATINGQPFNSHIYLISGSISNIKLDEDKVDNITNARFIFSGHVVGSYEYKE